MLLGHAHVWIPGACEVSHIVDIDVRFVSCTYGCTSIMHHQEWRSTCSCEAAIGEWRDSLRAARDDGARHVAAMERAM